MVSGYYSKNKKLFVYSNIRRNKKSVKKYHYIIIFMNDTPIPLVAYILVGITSAVLALVTVLDNKPSESTVASTTMLPQVFTPAKQETSEYTGGKRRKNKTNKKRKSKN